jgi:hypothetical protein
MEEEVKYYIYSRSGEELFTSNVDLAHKRADEGTSIKVLREEDVRS